MILHSVFVVGVTPTTEYYQSFDLSFFFFSNYHPTIVYHHHIPISFAEAYTSLVTEMNKDTIRQYSKCTFKHTFTKKKKNTATINNVK